MAFKEALLIITVSPLLLRSRVAKPEQLGSTPLMLRISDLINWSHYHRSCWSTKTDMNAFKNCNLQAIHNIKRGKIIM